MEILQYKWNHKSSFAGLAIYGLLGSLLVFGKLFSGTTVYGPLHLHDLLLALLSLICILTGRMKIAFQPLIIFFVLSSVYFFISAWAPMIFILDEPPVKLTIAIRQFAIILYAVGYYVIYNSTKGESINHLTFLKAIGLVGILLDLGYCTYILLTRAYNFNSEFHYYYSPGTVIAVFLGVAYVIATKLHWAIKLAVVLTGLFLSIMSGHASAVLIMVVIVMGYWMYVAPNKQIRWSLFLGLAIMIIGFILIIPQFSDINAAWRLSYWSECFRVICIDNFGILGQGFGVPYIYDYTSANVFPSGIISVGKIVINPEVEVFLSPSHNSFITIFYCIGLLPGMIILLPYRSLIVPSPLFEREDELFMKLSFIAVSLWAVFNVILEVPQTAGFYWITMFICWESLEASGWKLSAGFKKIVFPKPSV